MSIIISVSADLYLSLVLWPQCSLRDKVNISAPASPQFAYTHDTGGGWGRPPYAILIRRGMSIRNVYLEKTL